jgi:hypothetical protein
MWDGEAETERAPGPVCDARYRLRTVPGVRQSRAVQPRSLTSPSRHGRSGGCHSPSGLVPPVLPRQPHRGVETVRGGPPGPAARVSGEPAALTNPRPPRVVRPYSPWGMEKMRRTSDDRTRPVGDHRYVADAMPPRPILPSCRWQKLRGPRGLWSERHRSLHLRCLSRCSRPFVGVRAALSRPLCAARLRRPNSRLVLSRWASPLVQRRATMERDYVWHHRLDLV